MRHATWLLTALILSLAFPAQAQDFPTKTVRIVVAYPPGGPADIAARTYATKMSEMWGHQVVVENRPGANGNIAAQVVAKSAPDGYTVLLHASSLIINPLLYKEPGYKPFGDFTPISLVFDYKLIVVVTPSFAINSIPELVAEAKAKPGQITYASAGGVGAPPPPPLRRDVQTNGRHRSRACAVPGRITGRERFARRPRADDVQ